MAFTSETSASPPSRDGGVAVLSRDPRVRTRVAGAAAGRLWFPSSDVDELFATIGVGNVDTVVIDHECGDAADALGRLARLPERARILVILLIDAVVLDPPPGADLVVVEPTLHEALALAHEVPIGATHPIVLDRLLAVSVLPGSLEQAVGVATDYLAAGFGVDRCLISVRGDSSGGAVAGTRTWTALSWSQTAQCCHVAVASAATFVAPTSDAGGAPVASYLAVALPTHLGQGFVGLVVEGRFRFSREHQTALQAVAARVAAEIGWRGMYERATEELDRLVSGPGIDALLGIWNRAALLRITAMQASATRRAKQPMTVAVFDVVDLQGVNSRHGLEAGDRVLRRIADALRTTLREEDVIGRWSGDELAVILQSTPSEGAHQVAERVQAALAARPLQLPGGATLVVRTTVGIAAIQQTEDPAQLLTRAARAAEKAQRGDLTIASSDPSAGMTAPRISQQIEVVGEQIGSTLNGAYRLLHEISRGGMGVVYRAEDLALERPVAIKMLRPDLLEDPGLIERLRSEGAMLARIQHPNLVQIYSFGHRGGDSYFVMELVEGVSLEQAFERHQAERTSMPLTELAAVVEQVASALDALHERGIVHRDVKPANVVLDPFRSRSVLVDVGIAARRGQFMVSAGTPGYVAPEVIAGGEAGPRSDVYGLAATAYAMLTLTTPWGDGNLMTVLTRQSTGDLRLPSALRPELGPADDVVVRAMSVDPTLRPASAGAFARSLSAALATITPPAANLEGHAHTPAALDRATSLRPLDKTRGVVFRAVTRALGMRASARLRDALGLQYPALADTLTDTAPLAWLPTSMFVQLLSVVAEFMERDGPGVARDVARACVRASFRRFFPASSATLVPERTLSAIRNVWGRYHSWGVISCMPISSTEVVIRLADTPLDPELCAWTSGLLEQLVVLSGGSSPEVAHDTCEIHGGEACLFHVTWKRTELG